MWNHLHHLDSAGNPVEGSGSPQEVGKGKGTGYNVNIGWPCGEMGDMEYMCAFNRVILPVAMAYDPELVIISAGFDSAKGDPLGGCNVTPRCYAWMTHMLSGLANGRCVLALEGGYNLESISTSMAACVHVLLGNPPPTRASGGIASSTCGAGSNGAQAMQTPHSAGSCTLF